MAKNKKTEQQQQAKPQGQQGQGDGWVEVKRKARKEKPKPEVKLAAVPGKLTPQQLYIQEQHMLADKKKKQRVAKGKKKSLNLPDEEEDLMESVQKLGIKIKLDKPKAKQGQQANGEQSSKKKSKEGAVKVTDERSLVQALSQIVDNTPRGSLAVGTLGEALQTVTGHTWNKKFKPAYGTLRSFVERHTATFVVQGDEVILRSVHDQREALLRQQREQQQRQQQRGGNQNALQHKKPSPQAQDDRDAARHRSSRKCSFPWKAVGTTLFAAAAVASAAFLYVVNQQPLQ